MKTLISIIMLLILTGCNITPEQKVTMDTDRCKHIELFQQCLKLTPKGPESTTFNSWDNVIEACDTAAYRQSFTLIENIKQECR